MEIVFVYSLFPERRFFLRRLWTGLIRIKNTPYNELKTFK